MTGGIRIGFIKCRLIITKKEKADVFLVQLIALLHDIADWKLSRSDAEGSKKAKEWLTRLNLDKQVIDTIIENVKNLTYKKVNVENSVKSIEGRIVQDADGLDAIGAIGIARGFMFAGSKGLPMHDPDIKPIENITAEQYKNLKRPEYTQINHFYEELLKFKNVMNTATAKKIAQKRHRFMEQFLDKFHKEWEGEG